MKTLAWITVLVTFIFIASDTETRRHHENDVINQKMERYGELLKRKRDVIDKFIKDNYSDFNHSDYTPEVIKTLILWDFILCQVCQVLKESQFVSDQIKLFSSFYALSLCISRYFIGQIELKYFVSL